MNYSSSCFRTDCINSLVTHFCKYLADTFFHPGFLQRYFIVFLFWAMIGCAYGTYFSFAYVNQRLVDNWLPFGWTRAVAPVALLRWFLGMDTLFNLGFAVVASASVTSFFASAGFLGAQVGFVGRASTCSCFIA